MVDVLIGNFPYLLEGLGVALVLLVALLLVGVTIGLFVALLQVYGPRNAWVRVPIFVFERVFRGVPIIILLFIFYYGLSGIYDISSFAAAILGLGLRSGAYQSQIFRSALQSVDAGQMVAARAMGMSKVQAIAFIVVPQAVRYAMGPWTNEFSAELKDTSLAYVIGVVELTRQAKYIISSNHGHILLVFGVAAAMYFVVNKFGNSFFYWLEARYAVPGSERRIFSGRRG
jgi:polar amino acid transport system permease protein